MPLTAGGNLKIVASSDLGTLGAKTGSPVEYNWVLPSVAPLLLPWLAILLLLALKSNRTAAAWLIWLPLGCVLALTLLPPVLPSGSEIFLDAISALAIGLAAVWLLANHLRKPHRLLTFLFVLIALAGFSGLAFLSRQSADLLEAETLAIGVGVAVVALVSAIALTLAGWLVRKNYRPLAVYFGLLVSLLAVWLVVSAPFYLFVLIAQSGEIPISGYFLFIFVLTAGHFALLLPFLILSSANSFFRERLKALLNVSPVAPPVLPEAALKLSP